MFDGIAEHEGRKTVLPPISIYFYEIVYFSTISF